LGLLPVCSEDRYHLFESRTYGGNGEQALPELAAAWANETLGVSGMKPYVSLGHAPKCSPYVAVNLGVGENPAKRLPDPFEERLLASLAESGLPLCIDKGAGGEEAERVSRAAQRAGVTATFWEGSFAGFANIIANAKLYVGYDSAGQHVAAACDVPLISIFAGFPAPRMFHRWRPTGAKTHVIRVDQPEIDVVLNEVKAALKAAV
jgi:ADP-heptose:LPS heptosyltransferase